MKKSILIAIVILIAVPALIFAGGKKEDGKNCYRCKIFIVLLITL